MTRLVLCGPPSDVVRARRQLHADGFRSPASTERVCVRIDQAWADDQTCTLEFDRQVHGAEDAREPFDVVVQGEGPALDVVATQVATRYQRLWPRSNRHLRGALRARILGLHAHLHDRTLPLVRADFDHALDVWQWTLRLAPEAGVALQIAALFHDIERLESEALRRIEQNAPDYLDFKRAHAARGAELVHTLLRPWLSPSVAAHVARLVAQHEQPGADRELSLLNEADALSFFALNSAGYLAYYGASQTQKKVAYTLGRMRSPRARSELGRLRLPPLVAELVAQA